MSTDPSQPPTSNLVPDTAVSDNDPVQGLTERRSRPRRESGNLDQEIASILSHVEPEVRAEIERLVKEGKSADVAKGLLDYVVQDDHSTAVRKATDKVTTSERARINSATYLFSLVPVLIALYCIYCLLTKGSIHLP